MKYIYRNIILLFALVVALASSLMPYMQNEGHGQEIATSQEDQTDDTEGQEVVMQLHAVVSSVSQVVLEPFEWDLIHSPIITIKAKLSGHYLFQAYFHSFFDTLFRLIISPNAP